MLTGHKKIYLKYKKTVDKISKILHIYIVGFADLEFKSRNKPVKMIEIFDNNQLLTVEEVAQVLRVKPCTIIGWVYERRIPCIKLGIAKKSPLRFSPKALNLWLDKNSREAETKKQRLKSGKNSAPLKRASKKTIDDFNKFLEKAEEI